jgi:hypothetical protein
MAQFMERKVGFQLGASDGGLDAIKPVLMEKIVASRLLWHAFKSKKLPTGAFLIHRAFRISTLNDPVVT